jgi:hypothetical protein
MVNSSKVIAVLIVSAMVFSGCTKKVGPLSCAADTVRYSEEISIFVNNQTKSNCESVKNQLKSFLKAVPP